VRTGIPKKQVPSSHAVVDDGNTERNKDDKKDSTHDDKSYANTEEEKQEVIEPLPPTPPESSTSCETTNIEIDDTSTNNEIDDTNTNTNTNTKKKKGLSARDRRLIKRYGSLEAAEKVQAEKTRLDDETNKPRPNYQRRPKTTSSGTNPNQR